MPQPGALPPHAAGLRIGLLGGSFDPPHPGHRGISLMALRRLRLDRIWWLVSPGNPLKDTTRLAPLAQRVAAAQALAAHPRIVATACEAAFGSTYTDDTIRDLQRRCRGVHFVWLMGADNLAQLHRWERWRDLIGRVPLAVIDRPGWTLKAMQSRAAGVLAPYRVDEADAAVLASCTPPAFTFLHGPRSTLSSTALRGFAVGGRAITKN